MSSLNVMIACVVICCTNIVAKWLIPAYDFLWELAAQLLGLLPSGCFPTYYQCGYGSTVTWVSAICLLSYICVGCGVHPLGAAEYKHGIVVLSRLVSCGMIYDIQYTIFAIKNVNKYDVSQIIRERDIYAIRSWPSLTYDMV